MNDIVKRLRSVGGTFDGPAPEFVTCGEAFVACGEAADEIERLRVNEQASIATIQKWAAERVAMVNEIERLRKFATCGCGDEFTEHDPGTCGNCISATTAAYSLKIICLEDEIDRLKQIIVMVENRLLRGDTDSELMEILQTAWDK